MIPLGNMALLTATRSLSAPFHKYCYGFQALGLLR
jgi:hypothetical protein